MCGHVIPCSMLFSVNLTSVDNLFGSNLNRITDEFYGEHHNKPAAGRIAVNFDHSDGTVDHPSSGNDRIK